MTTRRFLALFRLGRRFGRERFELPPSGPNVIGATGGSGTRVVARIARLAGMHIGTRLNVSEDNLDFADFGDRWINSYLDGSCASSGRKREWMVEDFWAFLHELCAARSSPAQPWGWKEPRSIFLLPFLHEQLSNLRFVHVVRDGRDMAVSSNQNQLRKHGDAVLGAHERSLSPQLRSIALWTSANARVADYGEARLGERYVRLRFEDICARPVEAAQTILDFFDLEGDAGVAAGEIVPPATLGRWREQPAAVVDELQRVAGVALRRFGYELSR